jgi:hypothetical protein
MIFAPKPLLALSRGNRSLDSRQGLRHQTTRLKSHPLSYHVERPSFRLSVNAPNVFAYDPHANQLHTANE